MRGGEKSFEMFSSKEREAFELCSEILQWSSYPEMITYPGVIQLREDATKLYELISGMDMEHDDRYYKIHAEIDSLRSRYEELIETRQLRRQISRKFNTEKDPKEVFLGFVRQHIRSKSRALLRFYHYNHGDGYGDYMEINIGKDKTADNTYRIDIEEIFDYVAYQAPYAEMLRKALEKLFKKDIREIADFGVHLHDFGGVQYTTILKKNMNPEEVEAVAAEVWQIIKNYPRQPKLKESS